MTTPEPDVPVERSLPEPETLAAELDEPEDAGDMDVQHDPSRGTVDQEERR
jgi:hypothetical protein